MTSLSPPPFDHARIATVVHGTATSPAQFLAEFRRMTELDADQILGALQAGQHMQVARLAHRIEGACLMIGATALAAACAAVAASASADGAGARGTALAGFMASKQALYDFVEAGGASATPATAQASPTPLCAGLVFAVVEDHDFQRGLIMRLLRQLGAAEVQGYADGAAALQAARSLPPAGAILLLDLAMPTLSGLEVARIAGAEQLPLSIILHSAQPDELLAAACAQASAHGATMLGTLGKPLTMARLAPLIARHRSVLAGETPAAPAST